MLDAGEGLTGLPGSILQMTSNLRSVINPASAATCEPIYPNQYLKVNTIFNVVRNAGLRTAWSDKHPSYLVLSGPSGIGSGTTARSAKIFSIIPNGLWYYGPACGGGHGGSEKTGQGVGAEVGEVGEQVAPSPQGARGGLRASRGVVSCGGRRPAVRRPAELPTGASR
jgi:hypothetical protein